MALLNIGIVIFGAIYTFLPDLIGKPLYSDRMGMWHVWLTTFAATAFSVIWIWQGLEGAPRRFAVLPGQFDQLTDASIPILAVLALAQLLLVVNVVQTLRGKTSSQTQRIALGVSRPKLTSPALQGGVIVITLVCIAGLAAAGYAIGSNNQDQATAAFLPPIPKPAGGGGGGGGGSDNLAAGAQVFVASGCGGRRHRGRRPELRSGEAQQGSGHRPGHQRPERDAGLRRAALAGPDRGRRRVRLPVGGEVISRR